MSASSSVETITPPAAGSARYQFTFEPSPTRVRAEFNGVTVVDSDAVMVMAETRLPAVYYFPRGDVRMDLMCRTEHVTHCPLRGNAVYWTLEVGDRRAENVMWSYEEPFEEARAVDGYVAFYSNLLDAWYEDEQAAPAADKLAESDHDRNPLLPWLLQAAPDLPTAKALTQAFAEQLVAVGIPLWRLSVFIRTLHPQLMGVSFRWWRSTGELEEFQAPHRILQSESYLNSPMVPIFDGAGGIRRRLDIPDPVLDYGILRELHAEGATDYVAMPLRFGSGQLNALTMTSDRRGGFSTSDLGHIYEVLSVLGRVYEVHAMRYTATTLLDTYLGRHAGQRVLKGLIKRGDGENIRAVIWFCDLRESTPLAQSMSRGEFLNTLNEFFDAIAGAVLEAGGEVLRFIGDAALAIFPVGEPTQHTGGEWFEAHAQGQALAAALDARRRMRRHNDERSSRGLPALDYGVALHIGEVTYGNIGTPERLEFTVIGESANRAARIESMCKVLGRPVLASYEFARHFPQRFESVGRQVLKGVEGEVEIFALREDAE